MPEKVKNSDILLPNLFESQYISRPYHKQFGSKKIIVWNKKFKSTSIMLPKIEFLAPLCNSIGCQKCILLEIWFPSHFFFASKTVLPTSNPYQHSLYVDSVGKQKRSEASGHILLTMEHSPHLSEQIFHKSFLRIIEHSTITPIRER